MIHTRLYHTETSPHQTAAKQQATEPERKVAENGKDVMNEVASPSQIYNILASCSH